MMSKSIPISPAQQKAKVTRAANLKQANTDVAETTDKMLVKRERERYHLTDEENEWALTRLSAGDTMKNVTSELRVSRAALLVRAYADPNGFGVKLATAMEIGCFMRLENAENMILAGDLSTGSVERDREYMKYAQWMASKLSRRVFGDRVAVEHHQATVMLPNGVPWKDFD